MGGMYSRDLYKTDSRFLLLQHHNDLKKGLHKNTDTKQKETHTQITKGIS